MTNKKDKMILIDEVALKNEATSLDDVIDDKLLRYILSLVSSYTGSATFIMSDTHKETCAINSVSFCDDVFRKTECGAKACEQCDAKHCKEAYEKKKTVLYKCHNGIYTSATPIYDGKNYLGSIMCGQVLFDKPDIEFCKQKAKEYGIDEKEYIDAYKQIPIVNEKKFKEALKQVEKFAKELSNLAVAKNLEIENQIKEDLVMALINSVNEKRDLLEVTLSLIENVAQIFDADRILVVDFFNWGSIVEKDYFLPNRISDDIINAIHKVEENQWVLSAWQNEFFNKGLILIDNIDDCSLEPELKNLYKNFGLKSAISTMIKSDGEVKILIIEKYKEHHTWTNKEKSFLNIISKEIVLAVSSAKMIKNIENNLYELKTLINNLPFELWMKDFDGKYLVVNDTMLKNHNLKREQVIGKYQDDIFPENSIAEKHKHLYARVLETKEAVVEEIQEGEYWYIFSVHPLIDIEGNIMGFVGLKRDVTEQKELDKQKSEFISMVSHELRTPLTSIISGLRLALSGVLGKIPHNAQTALELSERNSQRLLTVINDILDVEKLSANAVKYSNELVNVSDVIEETVKEMENFAAKYNVVVNYKANLDGNELYLYLDKSRLIQVLSNLISNAIKFTENDRDVEIIVNDLPDDKIRISIINYGIDISEEHRKEIYNNFFKITSTNYSERQGAGLGLSVAHRLIKDMNGTIDYVSRHGKTVFFVEFDKAIYKI